MSNLPTAAILLIYCQWALALGGLVLAAIWFLSPRYQPWRFGPSRVPIWDAGIVDSLLVVWVAVCATFVGSLLAGSIARQLGLPANDGWVSVLSVAGFQGMVTPTLACFAFYRLSVGRPLPRVGATPAASWDDRLLLGAGVFCASLPFVYAANFASAETMERLGWEVRPQDLANLFATADSPALLLALTAMAVVVVPLGEEVLFRAGLFRILGRYLPRWAALALSAFAFAALHRSAVHFVPLSVFGVILGLAYERSGSLVVPVVAHGLFNLNSALLLLASEGAVS